MDMAFIGKLFYRTSLLRIGSCLELDNRDWRDMWFLLGQIPITQPSQVSILVHCC